MMAENDQVQVKIHEIQNNLKSKPSDNFRKQFLGRIRIINFSPSQNEYSYFWQR